jgi:hypothetical protein
MSEFSNNLVVKVEVLGRLRELQIKDGTPFSIEKEGDNVTEIMFPKKILGTLNKAVKIPLFGNK